MYANQGRGGVNVAHNEGDGGFRATVRVGRRLTIAVLRRSKLPLEAINAEHPPPGREVGFGDFFYLRVRHPLIISVVEPERKRRPKAALAGTIWYVRHPRVKHANRRRSELRSDRFLRSTNWGPSSVALKEAHCESHRSWAGGMRFDTTG